MARLALTVLAQMACSTTSPPAPTSGSGDRGPSTSVPPSPAPPSSPPPDPCQGDQLELRRLLTTGLGLPPCAIADRTGAPHQRPTEVTATIAPRPVVLAPGEARTTVTVTLTSTRTDEGSGSTPARPCTSISTIAPAAAWTSCTRAV